LRSKVYSKRVVNNKDLFFSGNPMKSLNGAQLSLIHMEML